MANDVNMTGKPQPKKTSWNAEEIIVLLINTKIRFNNTNNMQAMQNQIKNWKLMVLLRELIFFSKF